MQYTTRSIGTTDTLTTFIENGQNITDSVPSIFEFYFPCDPPTFSPFSLKEREDENIQKRDCPFFGPSFRNSCPRPLPHLAQDTFRADGDSAYFETLSGLTVSVKAGHGDECSNFLALKKSSLPHLEQT